MLENIRVVLMETSHSGNIGAVARAMKNMGLSSLYLVSPRCSKDDEVAVSRSSGATELLESAIIVSTLAEAVSDCTYVVGTSTRARRIDWPAETARVCARKILREKSQDLVALVFGREDRGLSNEELQFCHAHVFIPANPEFSSLNLAMAVQVISYEIRVAWLEMSNDCPNNTLPEESAGERVIGAGWDDVPATREETESFFGHLEETITAIGFYDPSNPRQLMARLRRLYLRVGLGKTEINILRGILKSTLKQVEKSV